MEPLKVEKKGSSSKFSLYTGLLFLIFTLTTYFIGLPSHGLAGQVTLTWKANTDPDLAGYRLYYGTESWNYTQVIGVPDKNNRITLKSLTPGATYYFSVTAFDSSGYESWHSNEASKAITEQYSLTVNKTGTGSGRIVGEGIECGSDCSENYGSGKIVTLQATPEANSTFDGWSGGPCTGSGQCSFTLDASKTITAMFHLKTHQITAIAGAGGTIDPQGTVPLNQGSSKTFSLSPSSGYRVADVKVDGVSQGAISSYAFNNITASHAIEANFTAAAAPPTPMDGTKPLLAVNCGGPRYTDKAGVVYQGDTYFAGGSTYVIREGIGGTDDPYIYRSERFGNFSYRIPLANGRYKVALKFAEIYPYTNVGNRLINVKMEGQSVIRNLDLFALVGLNKAYDATISTSVTDGMLDMNFSAPAGNAKVNAIVIYGESVPAPIPPVPDQPELSAVVAINCGGLPYTDKGGVLYKGDANFSGGTPYMIREAVNGTEDPYVYRSERFGTFSYNIPLPNGSYKVTLKFAEIYPYTYVGKRLINVKMEGQSVISNLDLFARVGLNKAYDVTIPVKVADGLLNIEFSAPAGNAKVNGILVVKENSPLGK